MKKLFLSIIRYSGIPVLIRNTLQRNKVTIILYHDIAPALFDKHLVVLRKLYNIISLRDYLLFRTREKEKLPSKSLIITFDDGHKGNRDLLPVLKKHNVVTTIFVCSDIIGTNREYWFHFCKVNSVNSEELKTIPDEERLKKLQGLGFKEDIENSQRVALSLEEIEDMKGVIDFQSHTCTHPILPQCTDEKSYQEIENSKTKLEKLLKNNMYAIAFPNGDFTEREIQFTKESGYQMALTLINGFNSSITDPFKVKRIPIEDDSSIDVLILKTCGFWFWMKSIFAWFPGTNRLKFG